MSNLLYPNEKVRPVRLNEMPKKTLKEIGIIGIIGLRRKE
jgi:hypothetical protein